MCWDYQGITSITSSWLSRDLCTISRSDREWRLDFPYQVTHALLASNFTGYVVVAEKIVSLRAWWWSHDLATI